MAKSDASTTTDVWMASLAVYTYGKQVVVGIDDGDNENKSNWMLAVPEEDFRILSEDYYNGNTPLSDARAFVDAFNICRILQRDMRRLGDTSWRSARWINGEVG